VERPRSRHRDNILPPRKELALESAPDEAGRGCGARKGAARPQARGDRLCVPVRAFRKDDPTECLAIRRGLDNPRDTGATLSTLSTLHLQQDDTTKAREYEEEAIAIFRGLDDRLGEAIGLINLGEIAVRQGDDESARSLFEQCLPIARSIENLELESECERNLGELALSTGNLPVAQARFARSLKVCRDAKDKRCEAIALWRLGKTDAAAGNHESARRKLTDALRALEAFQMNAEVLDCLEDYAGIMQASGWHDDTARLVAGVAATRERLAIPGSQRGESKRQSNLQAARVTLGETAFDTAWSEGRTWTLDEAIEHALTPSATSATTE
jgi:tetratricopeptide (TPR) repeat protein